jgi:4-diphosphocytidyl-2-C-methyl-D-erythritol kinase
MLRRVRVQAFAKLNLSLEVLNRRADGFHNLRTIFQTISLHDTIVIEAKRARTTRIELESSVEIPGENLIVRAAHAVLELTGVRAHVRFVLKKQIPMGGGLGGGSTDAAAVLLVLPEMLGRTAEFERLMEAGAQLGSDVPFFLIGGTALGLGRGTELYPLPDAAPADGLLVLPPVHVSTALAYRALNRTEEPPRSAGMSPAERLTQAIASGDEWGPYSVNDFEQAVFAMHPALAKIRNTLERQGASPARMTGSGAALFGLFESREQRNSAAGKLGDVRTLPFSFVTRRKYRSTWSVARQSAF